MLNGKVLIFRPLSFSVPRIMVIQHVYRLKVKLYGRLDQYETRKSIVLGPRVKTPTLLQRCETNFAPCHHGYAQSLTFFSPFLSFCINMDTKIRSVKRLKFSVPWIYIKYMLHCVKGKASFSSNIFTFYGKLSVSAWCCNVGLLLILLILSTVHCNLICIESRVNFPFLGST